MRRIVGFSLKFRALVVAIAVAMMAFGGVQLSTASVDVFPEFALPKVEIQTSCIGLTAAEVEQLVTVPLEDPDGNHQPREDHGVHGKCPLDRGRTPPSPATAESLSG